MKRIHTKISEMYTPKGLYFTLREEKNNLYDKQMPVD